RPASRTRSASQARSKTYALIGVFPFSRSGQQASGIPRRVSEGRTRHFPDDRAEASTAPRSRTPRGWCRGASRSLCGQQPAREVRATESAESGRVSVGPRRLGRPHATHGSPRASDRPCLRFTRLAGLGFPFLLPLQDARSDLRRSRRGSYSCRAYQVGTSVEDVVAALAHAGLERVLELLLGAEALVGPAAESSARGPDGRAGARRSARGPDGRTGCRAEQSTDRPTDRRLLGGASRGVESQFA